MSLSSQTLDHLLEAESHLRAAIKSASINENPSVIQMLSRILLELEAIKKFEDLMDLLDQQGRNPFNRH